MAGKALSEHIKKQKQSYLKEEKLQKVVDAYCDEQTSEPHTQKGAWTIAKKFSIENQWQTIVNRYKGGRSTREAHKEQQKLTPAEEVVLVDFIKQSADCGFPLTFKNIEQYADLVWKTALGLIACLLERAGSHIF